MIKSDKILLRSGTAASWSATNPKLELGEIGYEIDTRKIKVGDGEYNGTGCRISIPAMQMPLGLQVKSSSIMAGCLVPTPISFGIMHNLSWALEQLRQRQN